VRLHRSRTAAPSPPRPRAPSHARVTVRFLSVCVSVLFVADPRHANARAHTENGGAGLWGSLRCSCCPALPAARRTLGDAMAGCCDH